MLSQLPSQPSQDSADLQDAPSSAGTSSEGRIRKMPRAMAESVSQQDFYGKEKMHYMASQAICEHNYNRLHDSHLDLQDCMLHPIAFLVEMMGDVMYLHQALRQPDSKEFVEAVIKEVNGHVDNDHWRLIPRTEVPEGTEVVPSVWAMQLKCGLTTGKVTKHKARLNLHGGKKNLARTTTKPTRLLHADCIYTICMYTTCMYTICIYTICMHTYTNSYM
jgi:hypothetical protein